MYHFGKFNLIRVNYNFFLFRKKNKKNYEGVRRANELMIFEDIWDIWDIWDINIVVKMKMKEDIGEFIDLVNKQEHF